VRQISGTCLHKEATLTCNGDWRLNSLLHTWQVSGAEGFSKVVSGLNASRESDPNPLIADRSQPQAILSFPIPFERSLILCLVFAFCPSHACTVHYLHLSPPLTGEVSFYYPVRTTINNFLTDSLVDLSNSDLSS
jgi:hypothetical protein